MPQYSIRFSDEEDALIRYIVETDGWKTRSRFVRHVAVAEAHRRIEKIEELQAIQLAAQSAPPSAPAPDAAPSPRRPAPVPTIPETKAPPGRSSRAPRLSPELEAFLRGNS